MFPNIIGAVLAAAIGFLIAYANYVFSKKVLLKSPNKFPAAFMVRQLLQVVYLVLVYFIGTATGMADLVYLLAGAAVGMTVPAFFFTKKLVDFNDAQSPIKSGKEGQHNG